jgi:hypothetical protein
MVTNVIGRGDNDLDHDVHIYNSLLNDDPADELTLDFSIGNIGEEILAFQIFGYNDISMLKAFCEQVLKAYDRDTECGCN